MDVRRGALCAAASYALWGVLPLYWKALHGVPAAEILAHRMSWSLVVVALALSWRRDWAWLKPAVSNRRTLLTFLTSSTLLAVNWLVFIWAVNHERVVEASLGYFINPLFSVLLGRLFLGERLRPLQALALGLAGTGVLYLTVSYGELPWIALTLAATFGSYGLLRKTASLGSLQGLTLETLLLFPLATGYLFYLEMRGVGSFGHPGWPTSLLLAGAGVATAIPLLLFAAGARQISLTTLGMLQYIAPTGQLLVGVLIYSERLGGQRLTSFAMIWTALVIYSLESQWSSRRGLNSP